MKSASIIAAQAALIAHLEAREVVLAGTLRAFAAIELDAATVAVLGSGFALLVRDAREALRQVDASAREVRELIKAAGLSRA